MNFYDYKAEDARCNVVKMDDYKGKVVLVVNTATRCTNIWKNRKASEDLIQTTLSPRQHFDLQDPCRKLHRKTQG